MDSWVRTGAPTDWCVVDVETTGLHPSIDRVVEIGLVRLSPAGDEIDCWTTLVNPDRDIGATEIHGLTAGDLRGAPSFADIAPGFLSLIAGTRIAAHNVRFDISFLSHELARCGADWGTADGLCTMVTAGRLLLADGRSLGSCCEALGIELVDAHCAVADARAASRLLACELPKLDAAWVPAVAPSFPKAPRPCERSRSVPPPPRVNPALGTLASRVGVPEGLQASAAAATQYLDLLDRVLEDRCVTDDEVRALAAVAEEWALDVKSASALNAAYLSGVWKLALADSIVTDAERRDLGILAELLGMPLDAPGQPMETTRQEHEHGHEHELAGKSVCFTGASVVTIRGISLTRQDQERLAVEAGLVVKPSVSRKLDVLVLADPDSRSGKAKAADQLGIRKMAEPVFWRSVGVEID